MKRFRIPIFISAYHVDVVFGNLEEIGKSVSKYTGIDKAEVLKSMKECRGRAWNCLPDKNPIMAVNTDFPNHIFLATAAHEACHCVDYISDFLGIEDRNAEFQAHGVSAIMQAINLWAVPAKKK